MVGLVKAWSGKQNTRNSQDSESLTKVWPNLSVEDAGSSFGCSRGLTWSFEAYEKIVQFRIPFNTVEHTSISARWVLCAPESELWNRATEGPFLRTAPDRRVVCLKVELDARNERLRAKAIGRYRVMGVEEIEVDGSTFRSIHISDLGFVGLNADVYLPGTKLWRL